MRYIGIDPGSTTAIVILAEDGRIVRADEIRRPGKSRAYPETWQQWGAHVDAIRRHLAEYVGLGDHLVILSNPVMRSAILAHGRILGQVEAAAALMECSLTEIRDCRMHALVCGHGGASKDDVIAAADARWPGREWTEHLADAVWAAEIVRDGRV